MRPALAALGYTPEQAADIMRWILGTLDLDVAMPGGDEGTFGEWLLDKGLNAGDLASIKDALPGVFELGFAFSAWALGDEALGRLGIDSEKAKSDPRFNLLRHLGLSAEQIGELNERICGTQTIEGAAHFRDEHLAVFDCASTCGNRGTRLISGEGHIRMMGAAQPFISGAISKTINLPNDASMESIGECYRLSWELGLKANALYRDGCKLSQPLSTKASDAGEDEPEESKTPEPADRAPAQAADVAGGAKPRHQAVRRRLSDTRRSLTHKFNVAGHEGYLTVGLFDDGKPGELFITMAKEGSTIGGLMDSLGTSTSVSLQYGVPLESLVRKFTHQRFEPAGMTANPEIPFAKSLVDYIFRWLGMEFIPGFREANAPQRPSESTGDSKSDTSVKAPAPRMATEAPATGRYGASRWSTSRDINASGGDTRATTHEGAGETGASAAPPRDTVIVSQSVSAQYSTLSVALESAGDAPPCDVCGTITVRSGTCYKCLNCGASMGCS